MEAIILDKNFKRIAVIDYYKEFIWKRDLYGEGEAELSVPASYELVSILKPDNYISRLDDEMVCQIKYLELTDSAEEGKLLRVTAKDITKAILNKRVVWGDVMFSGKLSDFVKKVINENFGTQCTFSERRILKDNGNNFIQFRGSKESKPYCIDADGKEYAMEAVSYRSEHESIGDLITDQLKTYGYGCKLTYDIYNDRLIFDIIKPNDLSNNVCFSDKFHNVLNSNYTSEYSQAANVALVGGETETSEDGKTSTRYYQAVGNGKTGMDRTEVYVDADDTKSTIDWTELLDSYPPKTKIGPYGPNASGGYIKSISSGDLTEYYYFMGVFLIPLHDMYQLKILQKTYKGMDWFIKEIPSLGKVYFCVKDVPIALMADDIFKNKPKQNEDGSYEQVECKVLTPLYQAMMFDKGYTELANYTSELSFGAEIDPFSLFKYKRDYNIGDKVKIKNSLGISSTTQVIAVSETWDDSGYHLDVSVDDRNAKGNIGNQFLIEDQSPNAFIRTDDGSYIVV